MQADEPFAVLARQGLGFLVQDHGFTEVGHTERTIRFESTSAGVEASLDPREGVEVSAFRLGHENAVERWRWTGMVGRASADRLVEIAVEHLRSDPAILSGDTAYYLTLADEQRALAKAWTEFYSRKGPRPRTGKLP
jgi:hypothetical protein